MVSELKECMELEAVGDKGYSSNPSSTISSKHMKSDNDFMYPSGTVEV
jgi:hypothetical protein